MSGQSINFPINSTTMYPALLITHSFLRYFVLILLLIVIVNSFLGFSGKRPFGKTDNILGLTLFSVTHTQLLLGLLLYFVSPLVQFNGETMKSARYWTVEHFTIMLAAIVFITLARITSKKMSDSTAKHKRMLIFNSIALILILMSIAMAKRGFFSLPGISS
ncbi:cytochrome B [soil metagenome]